MPNRSLLLLLLLCSLVLQAESCWYPGPGGLRAGGEDDGNIIDDPEGRCTELPGTILPGLDFIPRSSGSFIDGPLWVVNRSTSQGLLAFDADTLPPASKVPSRDVTLPADSDLDGVDELSPGKPVVNGVRVESLALGLITAENYDEVLFFDPSNMNPAIDGGLARYLVSVSTPEFGVGDYPLLPAPGAPAEIRTAVSTRACARTGIRLLSEGTDVTGDFCAGAGIKSIYTEGTTGATVIGDRLFVSLSNKAPLPDSAGNPIYRPGTVLVYDFLGGGVSPSVLPAASPSIVFTEGYNPTDVIGYNDGSKDYVLVIVSGPIAITIDGNFERFGDSKSYIELIDADTLELLRSVELAPPATPAGHIAAISGVSAIDEVNGILYVGSAVERSLYSIDLATLIDLGTDTQVTWKALGLPPAGIALPLSCPGSIRGMAISDDFSEVYAVDYCAGTLIVVEADATGSMANVTDEFALTLPIENPEPAPDPDNVTLKGPTRIAVRPGTPGTSFDGSDLFVLVTQPHEPSAGGLVCAQEVFNE